MRLPIFLLIIFLLLNFLRIQLVLKGTKQWVAFITVGQKQQFYAMVRRNFFASLWLGMESDTNNTWYGKLNKKRYCWCFYLSTCVDKSIGHCNNNFYFSDLTDKSSFERAKFWVNELKTYEDVSVIIIVMMKLLHMP